MSDFEFTRTTDLESRLANEKFDTTGYIREVACSYDSAPELKQHRRRIQNVADQTAQKLKHNVYKNYELFIDTSKEISSLESEMYQLSHYLHEQESLAQSLRSVSLMEDVGGLPSGGEGGNKHEKHSISALLETVEGGSIVTEVPGRYLVHSGCLFELDQETAEPVQVFLLNDCLVIGTQITKRRGPVRYKFLALYELDNMAIVDVKDTDLVQCAFKILMFPDSHLYRAENEEDKRTWVQMLETAKQRHKKDLEVSKLEAIRLANRQSFETSVSSVLRQSIHSTDSLEESQGGDIVSAADWVKDVPERLDVFIAQRDFDQAVTLIEMTKAFIKDSCDSFANRDVRVKVDHRSNKLVEILTKELETSPSGSLRGGPRAARSAVGLLLRLGRSDKACSLFLENYRQIIERDLQDVKMEGTTTLYIANYADTFFTGLRNAALEFERAFGANDGNYSSFIVWCNNQLRDFHKKSSPDIFRPDVFSLSSIADCVSAVMKACDSLHAIGMDMGFALMSLYHPHLSQALNDSRVQIRELCATSGTAESWTPLDLKDDKAQLAAIQLQMESIGIHDFKNLIHEGSMVDLSNTTINFCKLILSFTNDVFRIYSPELLMDFIDCFCDIFNNMVELFTDALARDENLPMTECIMKDTNFVIDTVLLAMAEKINTETGLEIAELVELHASLLDTFEKKSRETTPAYQPPDSLRPAEPYVSDGEGSEDVGSEGVNSEDVRSEGVGDGLSDMDDDIV